MMVILSLFNQAVNLGKWHTMKKYSFNGNIYTSPENYSAITIHSLLVEVVAPLYYDRVSDVSENRTVFKKQLAFVPEYCQHYESKLLRAHAIE